MAGYYYRSPCPGCRKGYVFARNERRSGQLYMQCENCALAWNTPEDLNLDNSLDCHDKAFCGTDIEGDLATKDDIYAACWWHFHLQIQMPAYGYEDCICGQGRLFVRKKPISGQLYLQCEECETGWNTPADFDAQRGSFRDVFGELATKEEIDAAGWPSSELEHGTHWAYFPAG